MRALKKIMAALALTAVLAGCSADNILSSIQGGKPTRCRRSAARLWSRQSCSSPTGGGGHHRGVRYLGRRVQSSAFSHRGPAGCAEFHDFGSAGFYNGLTVTRVEKDFVVGGRAGRGRQRHHHLEREPFLRRDHR